MQFDAFEGFGQGGEDAEFVRGSEETAPGKRQPDAPATTAAGITCG